MFHNYFSGTTTAGANFVPEKTYYVSGRTLNLTNSAGANEPSTVANSKLRLEMRHFWQIKMSQDD